MTLSAVVLIATPLLAFAGALLGHRLSRKSALEADRWRRREESMRMLRWAAELSVSQDVARSAIGIQALGGLMDSPLLDPDDVALSQAVVNAAAAAWEELLAGRTIGEQDPKEGDGGAQEPR